MDWYAPQSPTHPASPQHSTLASPPPPPPPPKTAAPAGPAEVSAYNSPRPASGAFPPPLPPTPHASGARAYSEQLHGGGAGQAGAAPGNSQDTKGYALPEQGWVPDVVANMSKADLEHLLRTPSLLDALAHHPSHSHASLRSSESHLAKTLERTAALASQADAQAAQLETLRTQTTQHLLSARALDQSWRRKEAEMEAALAPFAPRALYGRLQLSIGEQEEICTAVEEGWIDGEGVASEREVVEWLRRVREGRKLLELRRERRARWDEGRVGGWR